MDNSFMVPDDILKLQCQYMKDAYLYHFTQVFQRGYRVCKDILSQRMYMESKDPETRDDVVWQDSASSIRYGNWFKRILPKSGITIIYLKIQTLHGISSRPIRPWSGITLGYLKIQTSHGISSRLIRAPPRGGGVTICYLEIQTSHGISSGPIQPQDGITILCLQIQTLHGTLSRPIQTWGGVTICYLRIQISHGI